MPRERGFTPFGKEQSPEEAKLRAKAKEAGGAQKRDLLLQARDKRRETLRDAPDLEPNQRRQVVELFQRYLADMRTARKAFRVARDPQDKRYWEQMFSRAKKRMDDFMDTPADNLQIEKTYLAWVEGKKRHARFLHLETELKKVEAAFAVPAVRGLSAKKDEEKGITTQEAARLERLAGQSQEDAELEIEGEVNALEYLYTESELASPEGKKSYEALRSDLEAAIEGETPVRKGKAALEQERDRLIRELDGEWDDPEVQFHEGMYQIDKLLNDLAEGEDVLEMPSVVHNYNQLAEWERLHGRTTIGGVLVGEPGTGKTTLVHHYLREQGRNYVYLDLSEEVTRYMLFGSKALEFKSSTQYLEELAMMFAHMKGDDIQRFIKDHGKTLAETYRLDGEEGEAAFFQMLTEELARAEGKVDAETLKAAKDKLIKKTAEKYGGELASRFKHLVQRNGWRDGVIIAALRRGDSVILDEFTKSRDLTLLYGLMTAKPGEQWYFEDNDEYLSVPKSWRLYFTANIGRRHAAYRVAEALASRAQGKVMEITQPPTNEELTVGLAELCDAEGYFLRDKEDIAKMLILIKDVFPKIRTLVRDREGSIPISWRTIRDIGEKLVEQREDHGLKIRQSTRKGFDQAVYEVLVDSYKLYEDKTVPREIVNICTSVGIFLDDKLKKKIVDEERWLEEDEWEKRCETREQSHKDWDDIVKELKGELAMEKAFMTVGRPERVARP